APRRIGPLLGRPRLCRAATAHGHHPPTRRPERHRRPGGHRPRRHVGAERRPVPEHLPPSGLAAGGHPQRDDHDRRRPHDPQRRAPHARRQDRRGGRRGGRAGRRDRRRRGRQVRHAGARRHALPPGRLSGARRAGALGRERGDRAGDRPRVGRALGVAAGRAVPAQPGRRRHHAPGAPGLGEPHRRAQRRAQGRAVAHRAGNEVPRRQVRAQDGVRREPEARLRAARPGHAHGQRRRLPRGVDRRRAVPAEVGQVQPRPSGRGPDARPRQRDARRGAARQHPRAQPLLPRRRDGADDRHRARVRLLDPLVPPRRRGVQGRRPPRARLHLGVHLERLGRVQDGGARRRAGEPRDGAQGGRPRDRPLRRPVGLAAAEPGHGQGRPRGSPARHHHLGGRGDQVDHDQRGVGAGPREADRLARAGEERRRGALVGEPVLGLRATRPGLGRRRAALRPGGPQAAVAHGLRAGLRAAAGRRPM
ncbi:MAG: FIG01095481: hypothetical protein, partial [uncultured Gemmatimonadaceae bacterium]